MSTSNDTPHLFSGELGEPIDGEPMIDKHTGKKILRPRNAWILYRNSRLDDVPTLPDGSRQPMADASKIISSWWKAESADVKYKYELEAEREKEEHKRKYPNYRFQPMSKAQKAQKKAESREKVKQAQLVKRKAKTRKSPPAQLYATSAHTSYLAAAVANHAQQVAHPLPVLAQATQGPSPPISLPPTPDTTPSPFPASEFEQGSSTPATSAHTVPSPSDALGLGLPSSLSFSGQEEASARVPRRAPARLPPRPKGPKIKCETSVSSNAQSSSSIPVRSLSPATGTPAALSPLPWPLPDDGAHRQQTPPLSATASPATTIDPSAISTPQSWYSAQIFDSTPTDSSTVELGFNIPDAYTDEFFSNLAEGGSIAPEDSGIFSLPMDTWNGPPPEQFDISLGSSDASSSITPADEERFSSLLYDLLANGNDSFQPSSSSAIPPAPSMAPTPGPAAEHDDWQSWMSGSETSQGEIPQPAMHTNVTDLHAFNSADVNMSLIQGPTPPADFYEPSVNAHDQAQLAPRQSTPAPQQHIDDSLPPHLASDPTFLHFYGQYLAHKQTVEQQSPSGAQTQQTFMPQSNSEHVEHQYLSQEHIQYTSPVSSQPASRQPSYVVNSRRSSVVIPLSPASSGDYADPPQPAAYTPPSGAVTNAGLRRAAGMWKRPPVSGSGVVPQWNRVASN